ncbi:MAG: hypothetical protein MUC99_07710 [Anaerolineae bacterium]|jgi:hypothetical protein|nr:hypothetical protein [Anaerolineae bacterium]
MSNASRPPESDTERVYAFIVRYIDQHNGMAPSQAEIAVACHMSRSSVQKHLMWLSGQGRICLIEGGRRSLWLPKKPEAET